MQLIFQEVPLKIPLGVPPGIPVGLSLRIPLGVLQEIRLEFPLGISLAVCFYLFLYREFQSLRQFYTPPEIIHDFIWDLSRTSFWNSCRSSSGHSWSFFFWEVQLKFLQEFPSGIPVELPLDKLQLIVAGILLEFASKTLPCVPAGILSTLRFFFRSSLIVFSRNSLFRNPSITFSGSFFENSS